VRHLSELARCCRGMALLFRAGLPLTEVMTLVVQNSSNKAMARALINVQEDMVKGEGLSQPMTKNKLFFPTMVQMVRVGEETGNLDDTLLAVDQNYEAEAEDKLRSLIALIQPTMTLFIGLVIGLIALSLTSAMYSIYGGFKLLTEDKRMQPFRMLRIFTSRESGATLMETVVALAILGVIAVTFLSGLATSSKAAFIADEQATAESLAQSQMEWAQNTDYVYGATQYSPTPIPSGKDYIKYSATIAAEPLHDPDDGIQKITVTVKHSGEGVIKLEGYKVDR